MLYIVRPGKDDLWLVNYRYSNPTQVMSISLGNSFQIAYWNIHDPNLISIEEILVGKRYSMWWFHVYDLNPILTEEILVREMVAFVNDHDLNSTQPMGYWSGKDIHWRTGFVTRIPTRLVSIGQGKSFMFLWDSRCNRSVL